VLGGIALLLILAGGVWFLAAPRDLTPATDSARSDAQANSPARLLTASQVVHRADTLFTSPVGAYFAAAARFPRPRVAAADYLPQLPHFRASSFPSLRPCGSHFLVETAAPGVLPCYTCCREPVPASPRRLRVIRRAAAVPAWRAGLGLSASPGVVDHDARLASGRERDRLRMVVRSHNAGPTRESLKKHLRSMPPSLPSDPLAEGILSPSSKSNESEFPACDPSVQGKPKDPSARRTKMLRKALPLRSLRPRLCARADHHIYSALMRCLISVPPWLALASAVPTPTSRACASFVCATLHKLPKLLLPSAA